MRIYSLKQNSLNDSDRLDLARLLLKAGYTVKLGREKPAGKATGAYIYYIEFWEDRDEQKQN